MKRVLAIVLVLLLVAGVSAGFADSEQDTTQDVVKLDIFVDQTWWPVDNFEGIFPEYITEKTGVTLDVTVAADSQQLGIMLSSGTLPDLVYEQDASRLSKSEFCYSYEELFEKYAPDVELDKTRLAIGRCLSEDGKAYTMLNALTTTEGWQKAGVGGSGVHIFYRDDLYKEMGSPKLETLDDFLNVLEMAKNAYPDKVPMGLGGVWKMQGIKVFFGVGQSYYQQEDGSVVVSQWRPEYKEALKYCNTLARKGYITAEQYANTSEADSHAMAQSGGCFAYVWAVSPENQATLVQESKKVNPDAEWSFIPNLGVPVREMGYGWMGLFVTKNCKDPEAATRMLKWYLSEEGLKFQAYGREGIDYTMDEKGFPVWSEEYAAARADSSLLNSKYNAWWNFTSDSSLTLPVSYMDCTEEELAKYDTYRDGIVNYINVALAAPLAGSDEAGIKAKIDEAVAAEEAKIVFAASDEEFEAAYENMMAILKKIGIEELNAYMTERTEEITKVFSE